MNIIVPVLVSVLISCVGGSSPEQSKPVKKTREVAGYKLIGEEATARPAAILPGSPEDTFAAEKACKTEAKKYWPITGPVTDKTKAANEVMSLPWRGGPDWPLLPEFKPRLEKACSTLGYPLVPPTK